MRARERKSALISPRDGNGANLRGKFASGRLRSKNAVKVRLDGVVYQLAKPDILQKFGKAVESGLGKLRYCVLISEFNSRANNVLANFEFWTLKLVLFIYLR